MSTAPLLLLHPFPMDSRFWQPMLAHLATGREVINHELPGFGDSPPSEDWSIEDAADAVARRITNETPNGRAVVVGLSMGGYVSLALAARAPHTVEALTLADTRAEADSEAARQGRAQAIATIRESGAGMFLGALLPNLVSPEVTHEVLARIRKIADDQQPAALLAALSALRDRPDRVGELPSIATPTLVVVGADDAVTPHDAASTLASRIPDARLEVIPGAGHLSAIEQPAAFAGALERFLSDL